MDALTLPPVPEHVCTPRGIWIGKRLRTGSYKFHRCVQPGCFKELDVTPWTPLPKVPPWTP